MIETGKVNKTKYYTVLSYSGKDSTDLKIKFRTNSNVNTLMDLGKFMIKSLQKLHSWGYVHCDIKPSNILYENENDEIKFSLIDFGISASFLDENNRHIKKEKIGSMVGSIEFMANDWLEKYRKLTFYNFLLKTSD